MEIRLDSISDPWEMTKEQLLAEMECVEEELFVHLTADTFDCSSRVAVFWGGDSDALGVLFFLRDHAILHL
jgi:hypothetical protein